MTQAVALAQQASTGVSPGLRNRIINGAMVIDQRNAGAAITINSTSASFAVDRWKSVGQPTDGVYTLQQVSDAPVGFNYSLKATVTTADASIGASQFYNIFQIIEGFNWADLNWGTANAKTVTFSFWVKSSLTGTMGGSLYNSAADYCYPFTYSISAANTWEYKTVTISGPTAGTWLTTNGAGVNVNFSIGDGSSRLGTAGAWTTSVATGATGQTQVISTLNATIQWTGVQLEVGSTATSFDYRPYGTELQLCQRYLFVIKGSENSDGYARFSSGECISTAGYNSTFVLPTKMRTTPVLTTTGTASNYAVYSGAVITACNAVPQIDAGNSQTVVVSATVASGLTLGRAAQLLANNNNTAYLYFGAEL